MFSINYGPGEDTRRISGLGCKCHKTTKEDMSERGCHSTKILQTEDKEKPQNSEKLVEFFNFVYLNVISMDYET